MSRVTKRKHVVKEVLGEHVVPSEQQQIVKASDPGTHTLPAQGLSRPPDPVLTPGPMDLGSSCRFSGPRGTTCTR